MLETANLKSELVYYDEVYKHVNYKELDVYPFTEIAEQLEPDELIAIYVLTMSFDHVFE